MDPASGYAYRYDANGNSVWEHELPAAPPVAAQPIPLPSTGKASKRPVRYSESSASESSDESSSDSSDDDCCECFRSGPAYKKLNNM